MKYVVVEAGDSSVLEEAVEGYLAEGWTPIGGVSSSAYEGRIWYCQAIVKE